MKNTRRKLAIGCVIIFLSFLGIALLLEWVILPEINPLRQSATAITQPLLKETPIGATRNEVKAFLQSHDWPLGRLHGGLAVLVAGLEDDQEWVSRRLGSYESLTKTTVFAQWHFDKSDKLDSIKVHKVALVP
jgi:hypothetical protein